MFTIAANQRILDQYWHHGILEKAHVKNPPKAEENENEHTHYQRDHVKNVKMSMFPGKAENAKEYSLIHRTDD